MAGSNSAGSLGTPLLEAGENCWRIATAGKAAVLIDSADYFRAARDAILKARKSILLIGWTFDPRTDLVPDSPDNRAPGRIGELLNWAAERNPDLDIRVLIWAMPLPYSMRNDFFPGRSRWWFRDPQVKFRLDQCESTGASRHMKILVVDDDVAFVGGGDIVCGRWDTQLHEDADPCRRLPSGKRYPPRHEVMMAVSGEAAAAVAELARERWRIATGESLESRGAPSDAAAWPDRVEGEFSNVRVGIARTAGAGAVRPAIRENEKLHLDAIASAKRLIFLENQYFTAPGIGAALVRRLAEPGGPEVVVICTERSPGFLDGLCMDAARDRMIAKLKEQDRFKRFHIYGPVTGKGNTVIVHSKVSIIDDTLLRVGSCNLANRSMGFDTECDLAISIGDAPGDAQARAAVTAFRDRLVAHYLDVEAETFAEHRRACGSLSGAIETLSEPGRRRLIRLSPRKLGAFGRLVAHYHLGDPEGAADAWRPWRRRSFRDAFMEAPGSDMSTTTGR